MSGQQKVSIQVWKLPTNLVMTTPWEALCLDLIGPYNLKGKDGPAINFMCVTMIDPANSWFEIVKSLMTVLTQPDMPSMGKKGKEGKNTCENITTP